MTPQAVARCSAAVCIAITLADLGAAPPATADIGLVSVRPKVVVPGEQVTLEVGCGFCRGPVSLPISLVPLAKAPQAHLCPVKFKRSMENALCSPTATGPPRRGPFVFLGATTGGRAVTPAADPSGWDADLRVAAPDLAPGPYALVVFCAACARGPRGSLIVVTTPGKLLWIARRGTPVGTGVGGIDTRSWIPAGAGAVALVLAVALLMRSRAIARSRL